MTQQEYWKNYPWYESVEGDELEQGDFIDAYEVVVPVYITDDSSEDSSSSETSLGAVDVKFITYNVVIVSQSCDFTTPK